MKLTDRLNKITPAMCRLLARKDNGRNPMSHAEVAKASGLGRCMVIKISKLDRWDSLPLRVVEAYTHACGVNLLNPSKSLEIVRRRMVFISRASAVQRKMYARLLNCRATATQGDDSVQR